MGPEIVNKNKDCEFNGPYAGRDLYITMYQDSEREFVVTHNANIKPVSYFTGRETELQELRQRVEEGRKSVLVSGMGGIGKTHICRKLFEEYLNKHAGDGKCLFSHIGYIEYSGDMGISLQNCLKFKQQEKMEQNQEAAWRELEYLASDGKLLLFVDNVDRPIGEDVGLQRLRGIPGAVVLTSRQASFSDEFEPYRIGFLGMEQCKEIYEKVRFEGSKRMIDPGEVEDLEYIIEKLAGRHTITVELLAHLAWTKIWTVKKLREELEEKGFRLTFRKNGELVNIQESYEVLYDLSRLTVAEKNVLEAFSVFPYIPLAAKKCNEWLLADAGANEDDDILMRLYSKGWLQFDIEQESYALHPVFAQYIYEKSKPKGENHRGLIEECQRSIYILEGASLPECQKYVPFAQSIIEKITMGLERDRFSNLLHNIETYEKEIVVYEQILGIYNEINEGKCALSAEGYNKIGKLFLHLGQYRKAQEMYEKGIQLNENLLGKEDIETAVNYNDLAILYAEEERYELAVSYFVNAYMIFKNKLGFDNPNTNVCRVNTEILYKEWNPEGNFEQWLEEQMKESEGD